MEQQVWVRQVLKIKQFPGAGVGAAQDPGPAWTLAVRAGLQGALGEQWNVALIRSRAEQRASEEL